MTAESHPAATTAERPDWYGTILKYAQADLGKAIGQIANTFVPYLLLCYLMILTVQRGYSYWITLALAVVAAGLLVRIFILFHDCVHNSFFASRKANRILGYICGVLTFTPYDVWQRAHATHHATFGNLDRRGVGDVLTLTIEEFLAAPKLKRLGYRLLRNPLVLFVLGPLYVFVLGPRFPRKGYTPRENLSVFLTDLGILAIALPLSLTVGFWTYLWVQLPIILLGGAVGLWLFYVQHQYEQVYWARQEEWDRFKAALQGSSYYKLPKILQWFTGNIGLHHIHHVHPRIPNYNLQQCYDEIPALQQVPPLNIGRSFNSLWLRLWDEQTQKLVSFREAFQRKTPG